MQTCRRFRDLASTKQIWLFYLRRLDQAHAPNLPYHVDVYSLTGDELRTMVIKAVQAHDNWRNGTFGQNTQSRNLDIKPPVARISQSIPRIGFSGDYGSFSSPKITLFPGGGYLLLQWTHGFVQLVDIEAQKATWTYSDPPSDSMSLRQWSHNNLCYDVAFQGDVYANIAVSYWKVGTDDPGIGVL